MSYYNKVLIKINMSTSDSKFVKPGQHLWNVLIMNIEDHESWRSTFCSQFANSNDALRYVEKFFEGHFDDIKHIRLTLNNYQDYIPESHYCKIDEKIIGPIPE